MKQSFLSLFVMPVCMMLNSCLILPMPLKITDGFEGRISDLATGDVIEGAFVQYSLFENGKYRSCAHSGEDGNYHICPTRQWVYLWYLGVPGIYPTPANYIASSSNYHIVIEREGYYTIHELMQFGEDGKIQKKNYQLRSISNTN